jgi:cytochrome c biogenesis protein CcdA
MQEWISQTLQSSTLGLTVLPAALLLGLIGAVTSCCNLAVIAVVAGYSGTESEKRSRRDILVGGLFFMLGAFVALAILGAVTGLISQTVGSTLGVYWKLFAGLAMVLFGLATLRLLPFKLPRLGSASGTMPKGTVKAMVFGFVVGGGITACSACCNPALFVALGMATLKGQTAWGAAVMAAFAVGYSLPLGAAVVGLGLGFGKLGSVTGCGSSGLGPRLRQAGLRDPEVCAGYQHDRGYSINRSRLLSPGHFIRSNAELRQHRQNAMLRQLRIKRTIMEAEKDE